MGTGIALGLIALIFLASIFSIELAISVSLIEITLGVIVGNVFHLTSPPVMAYLAGLASIVLTFLAGAEVDVDLLRSKFKESLLIGGISFLVPFIGAMAFAYYIAGWSLGAAKIAGVALSTTSLAVVYAVLVETGLTSTKIGKLIMASCFITDLGTAVALSALFAQFNWWTLVFLMASAVLIFIGPRLVRPIFNRYGGKVIEPEIKFLLLLLSVFIFLAEKGASHAVLPSFIFGLAMARTMQEKPEITRRLRVISFTLLTPFFFIKAGMNVSLPLVIANFGWLALFFVVKVTAKALGVFPLARRFVGKDSIYTTLLMSTGLTFGTISAMFGLNAGIINRTQFSILVTVVVLSAVIPTFIAQKWFQPAVNLSDNNGNHEA